MIIETRLACMLVLAAVVLAAGLGLLTKWGMDRGCIADVETALRASPGDVVCPEIHALVLRAR